MSQTTGGNKPLLNILHKSQKKTKKNTIPQLPFVLSNHADIFRIMSPSLDVSASEISAATQIQWCMQIAQNAQNIGGKKESQRSRSRNKVPVTLDIQTKGSDDAVALRLIDRLFFL